MSLRYFERKAHSRLYQKHMIREPGELQKLILSYLKEKKGRPYELAVDVGCGTGQSTRVLASYFQKVVGIDISEAQIQEAENCPCIPNVSYRVAAAEHLPFEDSSVDLITASVAAHWFNSEEFFREADRVLKPNGCLAMYCLNPHYDLYYKDCSNFLTDVFMEAIEFLISDHGSEKIALMKSEYQELFTDVPFADKSRVTNILLQRSISVTAVMGFLESTFMFQNFVLKDPEAAKKLLQEVQERILKIMGVSSPDTELEMCNNYCCVLACKSA
ncbi:putative methyltransferase DDB_G0268948 isoform X2 [Lissotriton helveticus]